MFTGIIEALGNVTDVRTEGTNRHFTIASPFAAELQIDQSVAHNGVCLTVVAVDAAAGTHVVTAIDETLQKTNLGHWAPGKRVNLERCLSANGRFDGHIVQGHVDL
ncbi:MAG TPA: riboflavin synthase, partial [Hymenobacter sp.]